MSTFGLECSGELRKQSGQVLGCNGRIKAREGRAPKEMPMAVRSGNLTLGELETLIDKGEIDTVIVAFPDMQGRLVGKRVSARLFREDVAQHGAEACNYLLAVDVEMNTVGGYSMSSWDTGYGDMVLRPDFDTLRLAPWLPGTAIVMS